MHGGGVESCGDSCAEIVRKKYVSVPYADQFADFEAHMLEQAAHLPVASFVQADSKPGMASLGGPDLDPIEARRSIVELNAASELIENCRARRPAKAHAILAFDLARGVHQTMRELAVVGEEKQPRSIHVEPADDDPPSAIGGRQPLEHGGPVLGIAARGHFADGLVVDEHLGAGRAILQVESLPVETDRVVGRRAIAEIRDLAVDRDSSRADPFLDAAARSVARTCEKLLQSFVHLNHGT